MYEDDGAQSLLCSLQPQPPGAIPSAVACSSSCCSDRTVPQGVRGGRAGRKRPCRAVVPCLTRCFAPHVASGVNRLSHAGFVGAKWHRGHFSRATWEWGFLHRSPEPSFAFPVCHPLRSHAAGREGKDGRHFSQQGGKGWMGAGSLSAAGSTNAAAFMVHSSCAKRSSNIVKA